MAKITFTFDIPLTEVEVYEAFVQRDADGNAVPPNETPRQAFERRMAGYVAQTVHQHDTAIAYKQVATTVKPPAVLPAAEVKP